MNFGKEHNMVFIFDNERLVLGSFPYINGINRFLFTYDLFTINKYFSNDTFDWTLIEKFGYPEVSRMSSRRWLNKKVWKNKEI